MTRRTIAGVRWVMILNLGTVPLSFFTNLILGRLSPLALGYYSAVMLFAGTFQTFFVLGGPKAFTRIVPTLEERDRVPFLYSYAGIVLGIIVAVSAAAVVLASGAVSHLLERFGNPSPTIAASFAVTVALVAFGTQFLWGALEAPRAALALRSVVVGFFLSALLGLGPLRGSLTRAPADYMWVSALVVHGAAALLGLVFVTRTSEFRTSRRPRWFLPQDFWPVVFYTHVDKVVMYVYLSVAPTVVLFWLEIEALAHLHAAMRWVVLLITVPAMLAAVLTPGLARLESSGRREDAQRQAAAALRVSMLLMVPSVLVLTLFASDFMALFGPEFRPHAYVLRIVAVSVIASPTIYFGGGMLTAFGEFRSYLVASLVFVAGALVLTFTLIPFLGLWGAALATTLGAFLQDLMVSLTLRRRLAFRVPGRVRLGAACGALAAAVAVLVDPGRVLGAALVVLFLGAFAWVGRIGPREVVSELRRLASRNGG